MTSRVLATTAALTFVFWCGYAARAAFGAPATTHQAAVIHAAETLLETRGVEIPDGYRVETGDPGPDCYNRTAVACVNGDRIILTQESASDAARYARLLTLPVYRRPRALDYCVECVEVMRVALHELVHWRRLTMPLPGDEWVSWWEEGLADAVAQDLQCAFERQTTGRVVSMRRYTICETGVGYPVEMTAVRVASARATGSPWWGRAAREWRLNQLKGVAP